MKNKKSILILFVLLAALVLVYFGLSNRNKKNMEEEEEKKQSEQIRITDIDNLMTISYTNGTETMSFSKEEDTWYQTEDREIPLSQSAISAIESSLGKITAARELTDADKLEDYGLENPAHTVTLTEDKGKQTVIYMGNQTGEQIYLTQDEKETVYTVSSTILESIKYSLDELVELDDIPTIGSAAIKKVTITKGIKTSVYDSADQTQAEALAAIGGGVGALSIEKCVNYHVSEEELESYGLNEENRTSVEIIYEDADKMEKTVIFYFGTSDETGENTHMMLEDSKMVNLAKTEVVQNILNDIS